MDVKTFSISGPLLLTPRKFEDTRGFFSETYNEEVFSTFAANVRFVQDNHSLSKDIGTIRGLHFLDLIQ